jgi:hypothetical protein
MFNMTTTAVRVVLTAGNGKVVSDTSLTTSGACKHEYVLCTLQQQMSLGMIDCFVEALAIS